MVLNEGESETASLVVLVLWMQLEKKIGKRDLTPWDSVVMWKGVFRCGRADIDGWLPTMATQMSPSLPSTTTSSSSSSPSLSSSSSSPHRNGNRKKRNEFRRQKCGAASISEHNGTNGLKRYAPLSLVTY